MAPKIIGLDGRPLERADKRKLTEEIADVKMSGVRSIWHGESVASGLTPYRLSQVLAAAAMGDMDEFLILAEEMEERDLHYGSVLSTRKLAVTGMPLTVTAAGESAAEQQQAEEIRTIVEDPEFLSCLKDLQDGLGKGFSVVEMLWTTTRNQWRPTGFEWRDPRLFTMNRETGFKLRLKEDGETHGVELAPYKFIVHKPKIKSGLPVRGALARLASVAYMCKSFGLSDWMAYAEVFGIPMRIGRYHASASEPEIATLRRAVASLGSDAAAVMPEKMMIEFLERKGGAGSDQFFEKLAEFFDKQISKGVLGQTMTSDDGSSQAQANVHDGVRSDIADDDGVQLSHTLNRCLVEPYIILNHGPQERYPRIGIDRSEPEDSKTLAETAKILVSLGAKVSEKGLLERTGIPEAENEEDTLRLGAPAVDTPPPETDDDKKQVALNRQKTSVNDDIDDYIDENLADWESPMKGLAQPLIDKISDYESLEALKADLPSLIDAMDESALADVLAVGLFSARAHGDLSDE